MVFVRDEGSVIDASLDAVWEFIGSGDAHSHAHRHQAWRRERGEGNSGTYSWEQEFSGGRARFAMHWVSYHPLGVAYEVIEGPFAGSRFFLYYTPMGARTGVTVVGEFVSPSIPEARLESEVLRFFAVEFDQDHAAIRARVAPK
ncbi:MAG TPA: hypothetical protein VML94_02675 [Thermoplasmata archaeon]|nr:hypothetical protein [Thermoplasmata archaeon]